MKDLKILATNCAYLVNRMSDFVTRLTLMFPLPAVFGLRLCMAELLRLLARKDKVKNEIRACESPRLRGPA